METLTHTVDSLWMKFTAHKIKKAEVLWADYDAYPNRDPDSIDGYHERILKENAYAIKDTACFSGIDFDLDDAIELTAERYGGEGTGANGGGGRCGNTARYQLKGVGSNCMVGDHDDLVHKYGGLDAPLAIIETIYTNLVSSILPLGAVKIRGLILTGGKTAFYHHPNNVCWGVIMMRDHCVRPAHFMRGPGFRPQAEYRQKFIGDVGRVRNINKNLSAHFKDHNRFIQFLGNYLHCCAKQFGFARAARIMHGTLTPSNITVDGKWLDLPLSSMLAGGVNYCLTSEFYAESHTPLKYALELLHNYGKYNGAVFSPDPLVNYYNKTLDGYFRHYVGFVVGLRLRTVEVCDQEPWKQVANAVNQVIHAGKNIETRWPTRNEKDPVFALIAGLFISLRDAREAAPYFRHANISDSESIFFSNNFARIIGQAFEVEKETKDDMNLSVEGFLIGSALAAFKRTYLATVFYISEIEKTVWGLCKEKTPYEIAPLVESYKNLASWIFEDADEEVSLFRSQRVAMDFNMCSRTYTLISDGKTFQYESYKRLFQAICAIDPEAITVNGFSFYDFFAQLNVIIPLLEIQDAGG